MNRLTRPVMMTAALCLIGLGTGCSQPSLPASSETVDAVGIEVSGALDGLDQSSAGTDASPAVQVMAWPAEQSSAEDDASVDLIPLGATSVGQGGSFIFHVQDSGVLLDIWDQQGYVNATVMSTVKGEMLVQDITLHSDDSAEQERLVQDDADTAAAGDPGVTVTGMTMTRPGQ